MTISRFVITALITTAFTLGLLLATGEARAEPTDEQKAMALFEQGRKLAKDGKCNEAISPLLESVRYAEGVGPLLNLGHCYESLGKTASAYRYFLRAQEVAIAHDDKRKDEAKERVKTIEKELSTLTIHVPASVRTSTTDIHISVDGDAWKSERWDTAVPIDPGAHEIEIGMASRPKEKSTVTVRDKGDRVSFRVSAPTTSAGSETTATTGPPSPAARRDENREGPPSSSSSSPQRTVGLVTGGVGIGGLALGTIFGVISLSAHSTVVGRCATYPRCPEADRPELQDLNSRAETTGTISTISFVTGAALLALGATLFLTAPK
jgi:hypothetical protein